jgi:hypothetical protein
MMTTVHHADAQTGKGDERVGVVDDDNGDITAVSSRCDDVGQTVCERFDRLTGAGGGRRLQ